LFFIVFYCFLLFFIVFYCFLLFFIVFYCFLLFFCCFLAFFVNNPKKGSVFFQKMTDFTHNQFRLPCTWYESTQHTFQLHICYFEFEQLLRIKIWNFFHFFSPRATQDDFFFKNAHDYFLNWKKSIFWF
jgi:hypothetical protein